MCNSFVVGDLVIDHTIIVADVTNLHQQNADEQIFEVLRRTDRAGGAANCARLLAVLSKGETYLWGITGQSHWGTFRDILGHSQAVDGAHSNIRFRGICDETEGRMNTVTRLICEKDTQGQKVFEFGDRFDESGHLHVPPQKTRSMIYYMERARQKLRGQGNSVLDCIIISDLDRGCLNKKTVFRIWKFARKSKIPLYVDPKYNSDKYRAARGTAIFPNLTEWCRMVGEERNQAVWRKRVKNNRELEGMVYRSLLYLGDFEFYIIKCDEDGLIFIGPSITKNDPTTCFICKLPPHPVDAALKQLGTGDVLTGAFALEFDRFHAAEHEEGGPLRSLLALKALIRANAIVAAHRHVHTGWHRMPSIDLVEAKLKETDKAKYNPKNSSFFGVKFPKPISKAMLFLPKRPLLRLAPYKTFVDGWFTNDPDFREELEQIKADFLAVRPNHLIIGAPSGCGKSELTDALVRLGRQKGFQVEYEQYTSPKAMEAALERFAKHAQTQPAKPRFFVVDEALKLGFENPKFGLLRLKDAERVGARLVLISKEFHDTNYITDKKNVEIVSRCTWYLPRMSPRQRPRDLPFIFGGALFKHLTTDINTVEVDGDFLLACTQHLLFKNEIRSTAEIIATIVERLSETLGAGQTSRLSVAALPAIPKEMKIDGDAATVARKEGTFTFSR